MEKSTDKKFSICSWKVSPKQVMIDASQTKINACYLILARIAIIQVQTLNKLLQQSLPISNSYWNAMLQSTTYAYVMYARGPCAVCGFSLGCLKPRARSQLDQLSALGSNLLILQYIWGKDDCVIGQIYNCILRRVRRTVY